ncbi:MAG: efflux RND transporter periplasmic adaptor subunit [Cyanobacteria bacterium P01_D01_bin.2]
MNSDPTYSINPRSAEPPSIHPSNAWPKPLRHQPAWIRYGLLGAAGLLALVALAAGFQAMSGSPPETVAEESRVLPVQTLAIEPVSSYRVPRIYTGEIAALRSSNLGFERGGELVQVLVQEGDRVRAGDPVARLDVRNLATQRLQVEAQTAQAQAQLRELENGARPEDIAEAEAEVRDLEQQLILQEVQRERREYLYEQGAIALEQLDEFTYGANSLQAQLDRTRSRLQELLNGTRVEQLDAQRAAVQQLQAQLQDIDVNLAKSTITAPFDSIVARRRVDEGTVINAGQTVVELVEAVTPEARIGVPAAVVNQLQVGSVQTIRVNNQSYTAEVDAILPTVDANTRTQTVVLKLSSATGEIEPGQTARLTIDETIQADGYWLPTAALTQGIRGLWTSYVLVPEASEDGTGNSPMVIEQRSVEIVHQESVDDSGTHGTRALVRGTLQPGEQVVVSGIHRLVPGQRVTPTVPD